MTVARFEIVLLLATSSGVCMPAMAVVIHMQVCIDLPPENMKLLKFNLVIYHGCNILAFQVVDALSTVAQFLYQARRKG
jgi:hypothetical protein